MVWWLLLPAGAVAGMVLWRVVCGRRFLRSLRGDDERVGQDFDDVGFDTWEMAQ